MTKLMKQVLKIKRSYNFLLSYSFLNNFKTIKTFQKVFQNSAVKKIEKYRKIFRKVPLLVFFSNLKKVANALNKVPSLVCFWKFWYTLLAQLFQNIHVEDSFCIQLLSNINTSFNKWLTVSESDQTSSSILLDVLNIRSGTWTVFYKINWTYILTRQHFQCVTQILTVIMQDCSLEPYS